MIVVPNLIKAISIVKRVKERSLVYFCPSSGTRPAPRKQYIHVHCVSCTATPRHRVGIFRGVRAIHVLVSSRNVRTKNIMNEQDGHRNVPDFQEDLPVEEDQEERFIAAMIQARGDRAPIQVFQDLLNNAPPVSVADLITYTVRFLRRANVLLLKHEPKIARLRGSVRPSLASSNHQIYDASVETIQLVLDAFPEGIFEKDRNGFLPF